MSEKEDDGLEELARRTQKALEMGGVEKISKQHSLGRLTARERIDRLLDRNSFFEMGLLVQSKLDEAKEKSPADGKICGLGTIDDKEVAVSADDVTVFAGAGGVNGYEKEFKIHEFAQRKGIPSIHLGEGGGARVPDIMGAIGMMSYSLKYVTHPPRDRSNPLVTAILGECYGGPTWKASASDFVIQVKGSVMSVASPAILEIATAEKREKEELGGWELHAKTTGLVDLFVDSDIEALSMVKKLLSYLPSNAEETPPAIENREPTRFKQNKLMEIIPKDERYSYDMHELLNCIVDTGSLLEFKPFFDGSLITAFARMNGEVVGLFANNPKVNAGAMGPGACDKALHFIITCDSYHIPLIFIHDTPGFYVSKFAEENKMPLKIINFVNALQHSTVPRIALIVRKSYGMAHNNMLGANMGADFLMAWPNADISFMDSKVALNVVMGRKLKTVADPEEIKKAFLEEMAKMNAPWEAAAQNLIDKIIDPRNTRNELMHALRFAKAKKGAKSRRLMASWNKM